MNVRRSTSYAEGLCGIVPYHHVELALCLYLEVSELNTRGSTRMSRVHVMFLNYGIFSYQTCLLNHSRTSQITLQLIQQ